MKLRAIAACTALALGAGACGSVGEESSNDSSGQAGETTPIKVPKRDKARRTISPPLIFHPFKL